MGKTFRPYDPTQGYLLPASPLDWLPDGHLAYFILDVVGELDLSAMVAHYEREERGAPPHHPRMMVALLLYAYCVGVPSSRKIEKRCHEDVAFRVVTGNTHPDHTCISEFRRVHLARLAALFLQVLKLCEKAGLVQLGHVALDGTKVKANASKHKAMSYEYMKRRDDELRSKIDALLRAAESADAHEDARYGKGRGDELPAELFHAESRRARIRELMEKLEAEAREQFELAKLGAAERVAASDNSPPTGPAQLPSHRVPTTTEGMPTDKAQRNFTDGDSRIMKTGDGFVQAYNCHSVVDEAHQVIVAQAVTNQPPDVEHFAPMLDRVIANCGRAPALVSADAGYFSEANVSAALERGVDPYIATERGRRGGPVPVVRGRPPRSLTPRQRMARKLATRCGRRIYSRRKVIVEPAFGQIKNRGFRQFLLRGLAKVRAEWSLITTTHNLLKLHARVAAT